MTGRRKPPGTSESVVGSSAAAAESPALDAVVRLERRLLDPGVRSDPVEVETMLHADFVEHGSSGRVWDRASVVAALAEQPQVTGSADDFRPVLLAADVVLLT